MSELIELYGRVSEAFPLLTLMVIGGSLFSLLGLALQKLTTRSSAAQRHLILAATTVALLAVPAMYLFGPRIAVPVLPASSGVPTVVETPDSPQAEMSLSAGAEIIRKSGVTLHSEVPVPAGQPAMPRLLVVAYVLGFALVVLPIMIGSIRMRTIIGNAELIRRGDDLDAMLDGAHAPTELRMVASAAVRVPLAWGWRRAVLVLPAEALRWSREMRRDAIIHELAHLDRRDLWFQTIARVAVAVHWFNPLAWVVLRGLLLEAEQACDDRVLEAGTAKSDYAERLLEIAAGANHRSLRGLSAVAMARSSQLATRIESLFETSRRRTVRLSPARTVVTFLLLTIPAALIGAVQFEERSGADATDAPGRKWLTRADTQWEEGTDADESPLYSAVRYGNAGMVESILDAGADPNAKWTGDGTPLIIAVRHDRDEIIDLLLDRGAKPDLGVEGDGNALIVAAERGDIRTLEKFIAVGADINHGVRGDGNPLIAAAANGHVDVMKLLVANGADVEAVVPGDENPLIQACERGQLEAARYLISIGADVNARVTVRSWRTGELEVRTPLSRARGRGHGELIGLLLAAGARD